MSRKTLSKIGGATTVNGEQPETTILTTAQSLNARLSTGIAELDEILHGGLIPHRAYLVRGSPGTGKTTLGLHFLAAGISKGETALFVTIAELGEQIRNEGLSLGLDLKDCAFLDMSMSTEFLTEAQQFDGSLPESIDLPRESLVHTITNQVKNLFPRRIFLDSMTQLRLLAPNAFQHRRQILAFLRFLISQGATIMLTSESIDKTADDELQALCDSTINLSYDGQLRTISISKYRGSNYQQGMHALRLTATGMKVFPELLPESPQQDYTRGILSSGVSELDMLLHGGLEQGTINLITGPSGIGKTTMALQFMKEAAARGEHSLAYIFEENKEALLQHCESVNIPVRAMMKQSTLKVKYIEPLSYSAGEFADMVRKDIEHENASVVMVDSLAGYRMTVHGGGDLVNYLHKLSKYLQNMGVTVLLLHEVEWITGEFRVTEVGISYIADNIIFLRYLELHGALLRAVGVLKKRLSSFERTMRKLEITQYGIQIGEPLTGLHGILSGIPTWDDEKKQTLS